MKKAASIPARQRTYAVKKRIEGIIQEIDVLAGQLVQIQGELEIEDLRTLEEMCDGRRLWSYEALLLGLLGLMDFYLAEVTVTCWRESYAKYPPSRFKGEIYDPSLARAVRNWIERRKRDSQAKLACGERS